MARIKMTVAVFMMVAIAAIAMADPQPFSRALPCSNNVILSVSITNSTFHLGDRIEVRITVTYSNRSDIAVDIDEGSLRAEFADKTQYDMFLQAVRASYARGVKTVSLKPGEEYKDILILEPKRDIKAGKFTAKILSTLRHGLRQTIEAGEVVFEIR